jgi:hypothetical protein
MTLYNLLRRLVQLCPMAESEKNDALALIDRLQEINAFSTSAQQVSAKAHECYYDWVNHNCIYCGTKAEGWQ